MADKSIDQLNAAEKIYATDLFVLQQSGSAKKLTGQVLLNWLTAAADGHGGIQSIAKLPTSGLVDTYRITLADTTTYDFAVTNGRSINSIAKTGTSGLVDTYTITYNDGRTDKITVTNGAKGDPGNNAYMWIKYASQKPTESSHSMGDIPDDWIGIYSGNASTAPTDWKQYKWFKHKGEKGDIGIPATLVSTEIVYQSSDSGTIIPSGAWSTSIPVVAQGKYLWKRTTRKFNSGDPEVSYDVNRMGMDGSGSVSSVACVSPDSDGNVTLTAADVGALPDTGGDLTGELRMNGQPISGLNEPVEGTQAATKSYVDKRVPLDGSVPMGGNLSMGAHQITDLAEPEDGGDAATKGYTDTKAALPKTASGTVIALSDASSGPLQGLRIYGRTTQDGTPTPEAPVELVSVGSGGSIAVSIGTSQEDTSPQTMPISTPNGLPGIPVTSGGNYTDADGQQWICDEVDYSRGIYVKRVTKVMFDGSGNIVFNGNRQYPSTNVRFDLVRKDVLNIAKQSAEPQTILSNYSVAARSFNTTGVWINNEHDYFEGRISMPSSIASTVEEFSELLANTPIVFIVPLATPIETPIPEDELAAYAALHTNRPNTTIYNDAGACMDVGYYPPDATMRQEDIRAYVDGKRFTVSATITTGWTGDSAPYYNTVEVPGILAADTPHITPVHANTDTVLAEKEAWGMVTYAVSGDGSITFMCYEEKPTVEIPIQIEVMR